MNVAVPLRHMSSGEIVSRGHDRCEKVHLPHGRGPARRLRQGRLCIGEWKLIAAYGRCLREARARLELSLWVLLHGRELGGDRPHLLKE
jgi:hypothetical protein